MIIQMIINKINFFIFLMSLTFKKVSLSRILQLNELKKKNFYSNENLIEFGCSKNSNNNFNKLIKGNFKVDYADKIINENNDNIILNLEITNNILKKYDLVVIFNVLEHVFNVDNAFNELKKILVHNGKIVGSTPFLYRIHEAPEDYTRYTKQFLIKLFNYHGMKNTQVIALGFGPFSICYSMIFDYIKFVPGLANITIILTILLDKVLGLFIKTPLKEIYPLSYYFYCEN
jgi:SAM-dependent methyltransferase